MCFGVRPPLLLYLLNWVCIVHELLHVVCSGLVILALFLRYCIDLRWPLWSHQKSCHWAFEQCDKCSCGLYQTTLKKITFKLVL